MERTTSLTNLINRWWSSVTPSTTFSKPLTYLLYNTQGIRSRYAEIQALLDDLQATIMTLVESGKVNEKELRKFTNAYISFISPGSNAWRGVIVLVYRSVQCSFVFTFKIFLVIDIFLSSSTLRILSVYSSPSEVVSFHIFEEYRSINTIIVGYWNVHSSR
jgi:hypothetical protein